MPCNFTDGQIIGTHNDNGTARNIIARLFSNSFWITVVLDETKFVVRPINFLELPDVTTDYVSCKDTFSGGETAYGTTTPDSFLTPDGYDKLSFPDGGVYYQIKSATTTSKAPIKQYYSAGDRVYCQTKTGQDTYKPVYYSFLDTISSSDTIKYFKVSGDESDSVLLARLNSIASPVLLDVPPCLQGTTSTTLAPDGVVEKWIHVNSSVDIPGFKKNVTYHYKCSASDMSDDSCFEEFKKNLNKIEDFVPANRIVRDCEESEWTLLATFCGEPVVEQKYYIAGELVKREVPVSSTVSSIEKYVPLTRNKNVNTIVGYIKLNSSETESQALIRANENASLVVTTLPGSTGYDGSVDILNTTFISGWAMDRYNEKTTVSLDIYINNAKADTITTNKPRQDVSDYFGISGFNTFGFEWTVPSQYRNIGKVDVSIRLAGQSTQFKNSPGSFTGTGTGTTSSPTTNPVLTIYNRVLVFGNSITHHPIFADYNWFHDNGMAASAPEKDFFNKLKVSFSGLSSSTVVRELNDFNGLNVGTGPYWESDYYKMDGGLDRFQVVADWMPDLIIMRIAENINDPSHDLATYYKGLIDKLKSKNPNCRIIITNSVWGQQDVTNILNGVANERNYTLVDLFDMWNNRGYYAFNEYDNPSVAKHPNDAGMAEIYRRIWAGIYNGATNTTTTTTSNPSNSNTNVDGYYANGFGEGSVNFLLSKAPFVPSDNQYDKWTQTAPGNTMQTLDNGIIKFGIGKALGGAIKHLGLSNGGKNWINTNFEQGASLFEGVNSPDTGRSGGWSMYGTPGHGFTDYQPNGVLGSTSEHYDTGYNPVHGGSVYGDRSRITWFERRTVAGYGEVMYCRAVIKIWALRNVDSKSTYHCYWWLEGNSVRYYSIIDNQRDDNQMKYLGSQQEGPFIYTTADLYHHYTYTDNNPKGNGGLTDFTSPPVYEGGQGGPGQLFSDLFNSSEGWVASLDDSNNGVILLPQHNTRFMGGQFQARGGTQDSNASSYINSAQMMNYDVRQATAFGGYIFAGNLQTFRNWFNSSNVARTEFSWTFGKNNTCGWWSDNAPAKFVNDRYSLQIGQRKNDPGDPSGGQVYRANGALSSPFGTWKASDIPVIYLKFKLTGTKIKNMVLKWKKSGSDNAPEYTKNFTATNSSNDQVIALNMSGVDNWNDIIVNIKVALQDIGQDTDGSELFIPSYIGKVYPS